MTPKLHDEDGWTLVTAIVLMAVMLGMGLAALAMSDNQQVQTRVERERESQLNLTEGVLSAQIFALSRNWPAAVTGTYPTVCTEASTDTERCPTATRVRTHYDAVDFTRGSAWTVQVRDNGGGARDLYSDTVLASQPAWDANADGQVWVRAEGGIGGRNAAGQITRRPRVLVARVRVEAMPVRFPTAPFVAGSVGTSNSGGHGGRSLIETGGSPGIVRCTSTQSSTGPTRSDPCIGYDPGQVNGTIESQPTTPTNILTPEMLDALRQTAKANSTHYPATAGCPTSPAGRVVFVERGDCDWRLNTNVNSRENPGILIINNGTAFCNGNTIWYGIIYMVNAQNSSGVVFDNTGGCTVHGGIFIDGPGRLAIGSNAPNLVYEPDFIFNTTAYGTAGIVQNTWRELPSPQR